MRTAARWLFIICVPVLLLTASIGLEVNSLWLYEYGAGKYGVGQELAAAGLDLSDDELTGVYADLVEYFNSGEEYISLTVDSDGQSFGLFTPEEVIHFKDVKGLIWLDYWLLLGTLVYGLAYAGAGIFWLKDRRRLSWGLIGGGGLTLALLLALVLLDTFFGFGELFYQFHILFFSNEFWSAWGYMLLLFPEPFFVDAALFGALMTAAGALILGGVGWWLKRKKSGIN
jgi:integral membrane protein (TIGR01906 family)